MTAIATPLPEDICAVRDGLLAFVESEVIPRHERNKALFENPRQLFAEDGRFSDESISSAGL